MNKLKAVVTAIETSGEISLVSLLCEGEPFSALIISQAEAYIATGSPVYMAFKETEVSIGKELKGMISLRNRFPSRISAIEKGQILSEIKLDFKGHALTSIITTASCHRLALQQGDEVEGLLKTTELLIMQYD
jgi:molybdate transport system regulatory protein